MAPVIISNMVQVAVQTCGAVTLPVKITVPVIIRNMVQIFGVVTLPVLKVLIHPAGGPLGKAGTHLGDGEICGVGALNLRGASAMLQRGQKSRCTSYRSAQRRRIVAVHDIKWIHASCRRRKS